MAEPHAQPRPHRCRVPRWVWFVLACMALGAMTSVGVAWGGVLRPMFLDNLLPERWRVMANSLTVDLVGYVSSNAVAEQWDITFVFAPDQRQREAIERDYFVHPVGLSRLSPQARGILERAVHRHEPLIDSPYASEVRFSVTTAGWPICCVSCEDAASPDELWGKKRIYSRVYDQRTGELIDPPVVADPKAHLSRNYGAIQVGDTLLPIRPLWPGLLANTAIYGGAWAVLIGGPILLRRWLRARRGGCSQCGYSREGLKVDAPCPECGRTPTTTSA